MAQSKGTPKSMKSVKGKIKLMGRKGPVQTNEKATESVTLQPRQPLPQKYPSSLTVSSNEKTQITGLWLTTSNKLWVKYRPPNAHVDYLKLFGDDGTELGLWRGDVIPGGLSLTCVEDTLLSLHNWRWINPSGESGSLDNAPNERALCSKSFSPPYILLLEDRSKAEAEVPMYKFHRLDMLSVDPLRVELVAVCEQGVSLETEPTGFDVSSCGNVFCVVSPVTVEIFCTNDPLVSPALTRLASCDGSSFNLHGYLTDRLGDPSNVITTYDLTFGDACFCIRGGRNSLIASTRYVYCYEERVYLDLPPPSAGSRRGESKKGDINILLELDHDDGFFVQRRILTDRLCTSVTVHGPGGMLWLGGKGSKIQVEQLYSDL